MKKSSEYYTLSDILVHLRSFFSLLIRKWWLILSMSIFGIALAFAYYNYQKPDYVAQCTFILEEKESGVGGLSGIASQFGFDIGSISGGSGIFAGDNILDILKSKTVIEKVLLNKIFDSVRRSSTSLADLYIQFTGIKKNWQRKAVLANINFANTNNPLNSVEDSAFNIIYDRILRKNLSTDRTNKKGTIIKVQVSAENSQFAKLMTERLVEEASKLYLNIKTGTAQANINNMQRRSDSLLALLNNKAYTAAAIQPLDVNPGIRTAAVPVEIASRDKNVIATLYAEVTKNLEASKLILSQQTPIIQILDRPGNSLFDNKKTLFFLVAMFSAVSIAITLIGFLIFYAYKQISKSSTSL